MVDGITAVDVERSVLARVARGDRRAFVEFARRWERPLYRFLLQRIGSPSLAEDARQLTLVRVFGAAEGFRGGSVAVWVFRIAHRVAIDVARREARHAVTDRPLPDALRDPAPSPQRVVESAERETLVRNALERLPADERAVVWLRVAEGLSFAEISGVTGEASSTVRYRFLRSLQRLRRHLGTPVDCGLDA